MNECFDEHYFEEIESRFEHDLWWGRIEFSEPLPIGEISCETTYGAMTPVELLSESSLEPDLTQDSIDVFSEIQPIETIQLRWEYYYFGRQYLIAIGDEVMSWFYEGSYIATTPIPRELFLSSVENCYHHGFMVCGNTFVNSRFESITFRDISFKGFAGRCYYIIGDGVIFNATRWQIENR